MSGTISGVPADADPLPNIDEVLILNRLTGKSVWFSLPGQLDQLHKWLDRNHARPVSVEDAARKRGWLPSPAKPSLWRRIWRL